MGNTALSLEPISNKISNNRGLERSYPMAVQHIHLSLSIYPYLSPIFQHTHTDTSCTKNTSHTETYKLLKNCLL